MFGTVTPCRMRIILGRGADGVSVPTVTIAT